MLSSAKYLYQLPSQVYAAGGNASQTLRDCPKQIIGRLCHLTAVQYDAAVTETWSVTPTVAGNNNFLTQVDFWDGAINRFQGGFNQLRAKERLQTGRNRTPDADVAVTSTNPRSFSRMFHVGPVQFDGFPTDFAIPTGMLENGEIRMRFGTLTELQGATGVITVATGTLKITVHLILLDELRIPPIYTFTNQTVNAGDFNISGRCLYEGIAIQVALSPTAFSAGDLGNITVDLGSGNVVNSIPKETLNQAFNDGMASGDIGSVVGEPLNATDVRWRQVNKTTPTALQVADNDLQPVLWAEPGCRISKLWSAESVARVKWDGSRTSAVLLVSRILPQNAAVAGANAQRALGRLNLSIVGLDVKTLSKKPYAGPYGEYMPWKVKTK